MSIEKSAPGGALFCLRSARSDSGAVFVAVSHHAFCKCCRRGAGCLVVEGDQHADEVVEVARADNFHASFFGELLCARERSLFTLFLAVKSDDAEARSAAAIGNERKRMSLCGATRNDVVDDADILSIHVGPDQDAAFTMVFLFFAVVGDAHVLAFFAEALGKRAGKQDAFIRWAEEDVRCFPVGQLFLDGRHVGVRQVPEVFSSAEVAAVPEVRTQTVQLGLLAVNIDLQRSNLECVQDQFFGRGKLVALRRNKLKSIGFFVRGRHVVAPGWF